jgi:hypothetical protein
MFANAAPFRQEECRDSNSRLPAGFEHRPILVRQRPSAAPVPCPGPVVFEIEIETRHSPQIAITPPNSREEPRAPDHTGQTVARQLDYETPCHSELRQERLHH